MRVVVLAIVLIVERNCSSWLGSGWRSSASGLSNRWSHMVAGCECHRCRARTGFDVSPTVQMWADDNTRHLLSSLWGVSPLASRYAPLASSYVSQTGSSLQGALPPPRRRRMRTRRATRRSPRGSPRVGRAERARAPVMETKIPVDEEAAEKERAEKLQRRQLQDKLRRRVLGVAHRRRFPRDFPTFECGPTPVPSVAPTRDIFQARFKLASVGILRGDKPQASTDSCVLIVSADLDWTHLVAVGPFVTSVLERLPTSLAKVEQSLRVSPHHLAARCLLKEILIQTAGDEKRPKPDGSDSSDPIETVDSAPNLLDRNGRRVPRHSLLSTSRQRMWSCDACTLINDDLYTSCEACHTPRPPANPLLAQLLSYYASMAHEERTYSTGQMSPYACQVWRPRSTLLRLRDATAMAGTPTQHRHATHPPLLTHQR